MGNQHSAPDKEKEREKEKEKDKERDRDKEPHRATSRHEKHRSRTIVPTPALPPTETKVNAEQTHNTNATATTTTASTTNSILSSSNSVESPKSNGYAPPQPQPNPQRDLDEQLADLEPLFEEHGIAFVDDEAELDTEAASGFLRVLRPLLEARGIPVLLPTAWVRAPARISADVSASAYAPSSGLLRTDAIAAFDWRLAVGDIELGEASCTNLRPRRAPSSGRGPLAGAEPGGHRTRAPLPGTAPPRRRRRRPRPHGHRPRHGRGRARTRRGDARPLADRPARRRQRRGSGRSRLRTA